MTKSEKPRGGVAFYKHHDCDLKINIIDDSFPDCLIAEICESNVIIAGLYIPPNNSDYFSEAYFMNLHSFLENYSKYWEVIIIGDMNARMANTFCYEGYDYEYNIDNVVNQNGRNLRNIVDQYGDVFLVNGLRHKNRIFDGKLTYHRGKVSSRNDLCLSNSIDILKEFNVLNKMGLSDHCPIILKVEVNFKHMLSFIPQCISGLRSYDHYDKSKMVKPRIKFERCNMVNVIDQLERFGNDVNLRNPLPPVTNNDVNDMCSYITEGIYDICKRNQRSKGRILEQPMQKNCDSKNFFAISEMYLFQYNRVKSNDIQKANEYKEEWWYYQEIAVAKKEEELNEYKAKSWRHLYKKDSRALWREIEWKPKTHTETQVIPPKVVRKFFTDIFQSSHLQTTPTIVDIRDDVEKYNVFSDITDSNITMNEVEHASKKMGRGTSFDGIPPQIIQILPLSLKESIHKLMKGTFDVAYPSSWSKQMLIPIQKKGHTLSDPKLRGVAIGPILSRLYDIILNERFLTWYTPNCQQAGFRVGHGCILQIFSLLLITDLSRILHKNLYIGLFDYEKSFDFLSRPKLIQNMMEDDIGHRFVKSVTNVYNKTSYVPQTSQKVKK